MAATKSTFNFRKRRYFSETFKKEKVSEILTKKTTIRELSVLYDISQSVIYRWMHQYSPKPISGVKITYQMESEAQKTLFYKEQIPELERIIGEKQIEIDFLSRLIEVASEELEVDIKKKFSTKLSSGSVSTRINENLQ